MVRKTNDFSKEELIVFKNLYLSKNYKCGVSLEKINTICVKLLQLGYNKEQVFKMVSRNLKIFTINSCNIDKKIQFLIVVGFKKSDVKKMVYYNPRIFNYSIISMKKKIDTIISFGYSFSDVIKMMKIEQSIFGYSVSYLKNRFNYIIELGYDYEETLKIMKVCPNLFTYSIDNIKRKLELFSDINLVDVVKKRPKILMQSCALTYARYSCLKDMEIVVDSDNYAILFEVRSRFEKRSGIKNEDLLMLYNYEEYYNNKHNMQLMVRRKK